MSRSPVNEETLNSSGDAGLACSRGGTCQKRTLKCNRMHARSVCNPEMDCRHRGELAVRWDYLNEEEACGTGWIVCRECMSLLERFSVAGGAAAGPGRCRAAFQHRHSRTST